MTALLITYDLNSPGQNHESLLASIKKTFAWARLSESSYAIATNLSSSQVFEKLTPFLDKNDQLFVIELSRDYGGVGAKEVVDWLDKHL